LLGTATPAPDDGPSLWHAVVLGIVEGLTEFLPVSSTGHLIVANALLGQSDPAMEIAIQAGAITAIAVLYRRRLAAAAGDLLRPRRGGVNLLVLIAIAAAPAAALGLALEDPIERELFGTLPVAISLIAGGVLLWLLERWLLRRGAAGAPPPIELDALRARDALLIGLFQCLALIPGVSRSGATIAGALALGASRPAAAEFSFLVGLPILYGAALLKLLQDGDRLAGPLLLHLAVGLAASFVTAIAIVGPFVAFVRRHTFVPFAVYRIAFGLLLLGLIGAGVLPAR
jgi:undecaprenyl-diphosphatase